MTDEQIFRNIYQRLSWNGKIVSPRGLKVLEIENFSYEFPPYCRFINFESRQLSIDYIKREFLWYLKGDKFDTSICEHAKLWTKMVNKDGIINSNYGQYIFKEKGNTECQFDRVVRNLIDDKDSRRASIMILNQDHILSNDADRPCTYSINFRIREDYLNMTVHMRSQDAIYGLGNDIPAFSFIHEMMLKTLQIQYPELKYGNYHHSVDSFHIYEKHFDMLSKIIEGDKYLNIDCPEISGEIEVDFIRKLDFTNIPVEFKFTKWLNTIN